ncbi:MAG: YggU family protein [Verrucomicrobia bacterium]|nr:YggU family protein [Verrucomicrobiota bacterium]
MIKDSKEGAILPVKVVPRASKNAIAGWENEELKVRLNAVPEKGEANEELIAFLAKTWKLPKSSISIHSGETSRHKKLLFKGVSVDRLSLLIPPL